MDVLRWGSLAVDVLRWGCLAVDVQWRRGRRAHLNSGLGSLELLLQGLMSGQQGAAPPLLLVQGLSHAHILEDVIHTCMSRGCLYIHAHTHTRTQLEAGAAAQPSFPATAFYKSAHMPAHPRLSAAIVSSHHPRTSPPCTPTCMTASLFTEESWVRFTQFHITASLECVWLLLSDLLLPCRPRLGCLVSGWDSGVSEIFQRGTVLNFYFRGVCFFKYLQILSTQ